MPRRNPVPWTGAELTRAAALWRVGMSIDNMAVELGRSRYSVSHQIEVNRDKFPRRRTKRTDLRHQGAPVRLKVTVSPFMHKMLTAEAKRRNVSMNTVVRDALTDIVIRKRQFKENDRVPQMAYMGDPREEPRTNGHR